MASASAAADWRAFAQTAASFPIHLAWQEGEPVLRWSNAVGQAYVVQSTSTLERPEWEDRATVTSDAGEVEWADDGDLSRTRFYRVMIAPEPTPFVSLQQALQRARANQGITGVSAAVRLPKQGLWLGTAGRSHANVPIRPHTPFEIGSVTKTFVAVTVLRLVDQGRLRLNQSLHDWLPQLDDPDLPAAVTLQQLLGHRSGIYNFGDDADFRQALFANLLRRWRPEDVLPFVKEPVFVAGERGQYSNTGYVLLGMVVERATGSTFGAELRRSVLESAGLRRTWMGSEETWKGELAHPHLDFNGDGIHEDQGVTSQTAILTSFWTSGAVISTAADLARFGVALFEGGLLSPERLDEMRSFQPVDVAGADYDFGLGLMRFNILGREHWAHSGGLFGEYAWFSYCSATRVSLGVAYNYPVTKTTGASLPGELLIALSQLADAEGPAALDAASSATAGVRDSSLRPALNHRVANPGLRGGFRPPMLAPCPSAATEGISSPPPR